MIVRRSGLRTGVDAGFNGRQINRTGLDAKGCEVVVRIRDDVTRKPKQDMYC